MPLFEAYWETNSSFCFALYFAVNDMDNAIYKICVRSCVVHENSKNAYSVNMNAASDFLGIGTKYEGTFPNIEMNTVSHLKLVQHIEAAIKESEPDIIITHHPADTNNDHLQTSMACQEAFEVALRRL